MKVLRIARDWRGLSYRDLERHWSRRYPQNALARATVAELFGRDTLPRKRHQLDQLLELLFGQENSESKKLLQVFQSTAWDLLRRQADIPDFPRPTPEGASGHSRDSGMAELHVSIAKLLAGRGQWRQAYYHMLTATKMRDGENGWKTLGGEVVFHETQRG